MTSVRAIFECWGKRTYVTKSAAWIALRKLQRRHVLRSERGRRVEPYRCTSCQQFHLGSSWVLDTRQRSIRPNAQRPTKDFADHGP